MKMSRLLFVFDDNYVYPFLMTLGSLAINSKQTNSVVIVNIDGWLGDTPLVSPESIHIVRKVCDALDLDLEVVTLEVPKTFPSWDLHTYGHISIAAWAKVVALFQLSFQQDEDLIYIDPDTLLLEGFDEVHNLATEASTSLIARQTTGHQGFENYWSKQRAKSVTKEFMTADWYFNSGVLKLNSQTWRNYDFWIAWDELIQFPKKYNLKIVDQDLLNALVLGNYGRLPVSFNSYPSEYNVDSTRIIHFAGGLKPWYYRHPLSRFHLDEPTRRAMRLWRDNEKRTLELLEKHSDPELLYKLRILRKNLDKNYRFVIVQLFPRISKSKLALALNVIRKRIRHEI